MLPARYSSTRASSVITITGLGDHDQPEWLITMTGIRIDKPRLFAQPSERPGKGSSTPEKPADRCA
jgi:hypothetical protein